MMSIHSMRGRAVSLLRRMKAVGPETRDATTPKTAFVLLGGGARGAAQAGALTTVLEAGVTPDLIVGISAGSWNGAYLAVDPTAERALRLEGLWIATTSRDIIGTRRWSVPLNVVASRAALYGSGGLRRLAERYLPNSTFEQLPVPLRVLAVDLVSGQPRVFAEGTLLPAIIASSSVPGVFPPIIAEGEVLADGGLAEWTGCQIAMEFGARRIVLVACGGARREKPKLQTYRQILARSMEISSRGHFARTVFALRAAGYDVLPIYPDLPLGSMLDFDHAPELIQAGRRAAAQAIEEWRPAPAPRPANVVTRVRAARLALAPSGA